MSAEDIENLLDPGQIEIRRDGSGKPSIVIGGEEKSVSRFIRSFPLTSPNTYVSVWDEDGNELGVIENVRKLDESSRKVVDEELEKAYFMPRIRKILRVKELYGGITEFSVETDRGYRDFEIHGRSAVRMMGASRVVITDVDGNKYEIRNLKDLDSRSKSLFGWVV